MNKLIIVLVLSVVSAVHTHTGTGKADIGVDEKLGGMIASDAEFFDDQGARVALGKVIDRPTIIAPVYLTCVHACPVLLTGVADVLGKLEMVSPGKDFQVITLSFDERDAPKRAAEKKKDYLKAVGKPFPADAWRFMTGSRKNIEKFTQSIGYRFQRSGEEFDHPVTLIVVAPGGKITRYLYGSRFLPLDVTLAVAEAEKGKVGLSTRKFMSFCFSYDPLEKTYVFDILKVSGIVMIIVAVSFFTYLTITATKKRGADR